MIYDLPDPQARIRQGDIFGQIPYIEFDPAQLLVVADAGKPEAEVLDWLQIAARMERTPALVTFRSVYAIVITQDCDAVRATDIAMCEIDCFEVVHPPAKGSDWVRYPHGGGPFVDHARLEDLSGAEPSYLASGVS
jgi:hypothetical protein